MNLLEYIKANGGTGTLSCPVLTSMATQLECSAGTLYMIALGHKTPGPKFAQRIEQATEGKVSKSTLRPDIWEAVDVPRAA